MPRPATRARHPSASTIRWRANRPDPALAAHDPRGRARSHVVDGGIVDGAGVARAAAARRASRHAMQPSSVLIADGLPFGGRQHHHALGADLGDHARAVRS